MLFPHTSHEPRYPFVLSVDETREINAELIAFADSAVFERKGGGIAKTISVAPRGPGKPILDLSGKPSQRYRKPSRWSECAVPPPPPVSRWHEPENWYDPSNGIGCRVLNCGRGVDRPLLLPETAEYARENPFSFHSDPHTYVCERHYALLAEELAKPSRGYVVDFQWKNPQDNRREVRIRYPV
ncbi:hypothetical protein [Nocardia sputorum]|uniref:hypothetical protein n=1 Tax=Nocardia sputorum TaxID=2984338 RepID=UPI00248F56BF|nr:hypothetical protein [Nocardia sputorum]